MNILYFCKTLIIGTFFLISNGEELTAHHRKIPQQPPDHQRPLKIAPFSPNPPKAFTFSTSAQEVSIPELIQNGHQHHQHIISIRGEISQPELHLDTTELYLDFVFRLKQGTDSLVVYGRHDRTLGPPAIQMGSTVIVVGTFFKEQDRNGTLLLNVLEAIEVKPYPSSIPQST